MNTLNLIADYELTLKNPNFTSLPPSYFNSSGEKGVYILVRYAIENILHYTPREAARLLTVSMLDKLKLKKTIDEQIIMPAGFTQDDYIRFLLNKCYPKIVYFNFKDYVINIYDDVLNKNKKISFPKRFFKEEHDGRKCAMVCLIHLISRYYAPKMNSIQDIYEYFSDNEKMIKEMKKYKLYKPFVDLFGGDALLFLHSSLASTQRDNFCFEYYNFMRKYNLFKKNHEEILETNINQNLASKEECASLIEALYNLENGISMKY